MNTPKLAHSDPASDALMSAGSPSLLSLSVGGELLAVPIADVREILELGRLTPMPRTPDFVCGMMNLRGAVVPVIDLAVRLGGPPSQPGPRTCIVIVDALDLLPESADDDREAAGLTVGMLVDSVHEVFDVAATEVEPVPTLGTAVEARFLALMTRHHGRVLGVLALERVLAPTELGALIAGHLPAAQPSTAMAARP